MIIATEWGFAHNSANHIMSLLIMMLCHVDIMNYDITVFADSIIP